VSAEFVAVLRVLDHEGDRSDAAVEVEART